MIYRKIIQELQRFHEAVRPYALLIDGARQVGKTYIIESFGREHYDSFIEIDFIKTPDACNILRNVEIEVKSGKHYARHSALSHLLSDPEYDLPLAYVFNDKRWKTESNISYLPIYMAMFLRPSPLPEKMIFEV